MNRTAWALLLILTPIPVRATDAPPAESAPKEMNQARAAGWEMAALVLEKLEAGDNNNFPGIRTWLTELRRQTKGVGAGVAVERWPAFDVDAVLTHNPNYWRAYYEIAPGDPGLALLHAGLLLSAGEATRAAYVLVLAEQRPGIPEPLPEAFRRLIAHSEAVRIQMNKAVDPGIHLYDQGDFDGAFRKHREAVRRWPTSGFAHYELGLTLSQQERVAAGEKPLPNDTLVINGNFKQSAAVSAAYARARQHDPFQLKAYQGDDQKVIEGFRALVGKGMPAWQKLLRTRPKAVDDATLVALAAACQQAQSHELAVFARQALVARRGRYAPEDHPFITTSLRALAPGKVTDKTLERLAGDRALQLRQLVAPASSGR